MSLTPTVTKVLESFVGQWVLYEVEGKIDNRQYGTLRGGSTTHELVDILNQRHQALENNFYLWKWYLSIYRAFGHVGNYTVLRKLTDL